MPAKASEEFKEHCLDVYERLGDAEATAREVGNVSACAVLKWHHDAYDRAAMKKARLFRKWERPYGMALWQARLERARRDALFVRLLSASSDGPVLS